jgi:hypothetical protein
MAASEPHFTVVSRHLDGAIVLDVDLGAGLLRDLADHLAACDPITSRILSLGMLMTW